MDIVTISDKKNTLFSSVYSIVFVLSCGEGQGLKLGRALIHTK